MKLSLLMFSFKQPTPKGETSSSSSLKHWKNARLTWSHTSPTSEGKSLLTTNRTLSWLSLLLLVLLPWQHLLHLTESKRQVHGSYTPCHTVHERIALCSVFVLGASFMATCLNCTFHNAPISHRPCGAGVPTLCICHWPCTVCTPHKSVRLTKTW